MSPDQAANAILRGEYSLEAAEVWITWRQKNNTAMIMDRLCVWLVQRVKELEAQHAQIGDEGICDAKKRG